ncbi:phage DNA ejection protein [Yokenella regensburgei]|uniref:phage DNA ejection protein n=1 Tax=Yokenella regensburgei TaxID=158877 RepID=UPI0031E25E2B
MPIGSRYNPTNYINMANQGVASGVASARGVADLYQRGFNQRVAEEDRQRLLDARREFETAWATGSPDDVNRVMARFPEFAAKIQQGIGIRDEQQRQKVGGMAMQLGGLLDAGNVQGAQDYIRQHADLFDKAGPYSAESVATAIGKAGNDPKQLQQWKDWTKKLIPSALTTTEMVDQNFKQQQLLAELQMSNDRLKTQLQMSNDRIALGRSRIDSMEDLRSKTQMQRAYEWWKGLPEAERKEAIKFMPGGARSALPTGMVKAKLVDGRTIDVFPKMEKQGSVGFYRGIDADGNMVNVPVDSIVGTPTSGQRAGEAMTAQDLQTLKEAPSTELGSITGALRGGSLGEMPLGAETYTGYTGTGREVFSAAKRIQGRMQNQGIGAAREMGASGINTVAEAKMFFQSMPQLDFSSEAALRESVERIDEYIKQSNEKFNVTTDGKKTDVTGMSDADLLEGL